jgi:hypothetical protein
MTIDDYSNWEAPLYERSSSMEMAMAFIHIDLRDGEVDLWTGFQGDCIPIKIWLGVVRGVEVPATIRRDALDGLLDRLAALLPAIVFGATLEQDQEGNWRGRLSERAQATLSQFAAQCFVGCESHADFIHVRDFIAAVDVAADADIRSLIAQCEAERQRLEFVIEGNIAHALRLKQAKAVDQRNRRGQRSFWGQSLRCLPLGSKGCHPTGTAQKWQ